MGSSEAMDQKTSPGDTTLEAVRISPQDTYQQVTSGKAFLVCENDKMDRPQHTNRDANIRA
jgi:hypothetical protein